jgi:hypothetical protein
VPGDINAVYVRNGANPCFDVDGMVHAMRIRNGAAETARSARTDIGLIPGWTSTTASTSVVWNADEVVVVGSPRRLHLPHTRRATPSCRRPSHRSR